jgi:hypothetical protein
MELSVTPALPNSRKRLTKSRENEREESITGRGGARRRRRKRRILEELAARVSCQKRNKETCYKERDLL